MRQISHLSILSFLPSFTSLFFLLFSYLVFDVVFGVQSLSPVKKSLFSRITNHGLFTFYFSHLALLSTSLLPCLTPYPIFCLPQLSIHLDIKTTIRISDYSSNFFFSIIAIYTALPSPINRDTSHPVSLSIISISFFETKR